MIFIIWNVSAGGFHHNWSCLSWTNCYQNLAVSSNHPLHFNHVLYKYFLGNQLLMFDMCIIFKNTSMQRVSTKIIIRNYIFHTFLVYKGKTIPRRFYFIFIFKTFFSQHLMSGCDCWGPDGRLDTKIEQSYEL